MTTSQKIKVRSCSINCIAHPEWGTWGVIEKLDGYFEIRGEAGDRILDFDEADKFWEVIS